MILEPENEGVAALDVPPESDGDRLALGFDTERAVFDWRLEELLRAGYGPINAEAIAWQHRVDLHRACGLLAQGCSEELAASILL